MTKTEASETRLLFIFLSVTLSLCEESFFALLKILAMTQCEFRC